MYLFLIPLLIGFALVGLSAFTTASARRWGAKLGMKVTFVLRNILGIPLLILGAVLAWTSDAPFLFAPNKITRLAALFLIIAGAVPFVWGHINIGRPSHMPSMDDVLVSSGLYAYVRHPIYSGAMVLLVGLILMRPSTTWALGCVLAIVWLVVQARLEEMDLVQRMPSYRDYMLTVPRFLPRMR
ncbi:MAG: methyltransferase [Thermodesulfobacteriota bacterium]